MNQLLWGGAHVANVLGVTPAAVANWRRRYDGTPSPTHTVIDGMPLWDARGLEEWIRWHALFRDRLR